MLIPISSYWRKENIVKGKEEVRLLCTRLDYLFDPGKCITENKKEKNQRSTSQNSKAKTVINDPADCIGVFLMWSYIILSD